jgi:hypothetical protein
MRTLFEDTNVKAELEEAATRGKEGKYTMLYLWLLAAAFLVGTWGIYRWADNRPAVQPPPEPASLDSPKQTSETFGKFNRYIEEGNWVEAENMLSTAAKQKLMAEGKTLRDSLHGDLTNYKITQATTTQSIDRSIPGRMRQDCYFVFNDAQFAKTVDKIVPLVLVIENGRLVIDSWWDIKPEEPNKV